MKDIRFLLIFFILFIFIWGCSTSKFAEKGENTEDTAELIIEESQLSYQESIMENDSIMIHHLEETREILECHLEAEKKKKTFWTIVAGTEGVVIVILGVLLML